MRYCIVLFLVLLSLFAKAQENYSTLTRKALETMWKAKDENGYKKALEMYEDAFHIYPDSIDETGLYKASVIASELKEYDKAFKYLTCLANEKDYLGWRYVVSENEYKNLIADPRWNALKIKAIKDKEKFYNELKEKEDEFFSRKPNNLNKVKNEKSLYETIRNFNPYKEKKVGIILFHSK